MNNDNDLNLHLHDQMSGWLPLLPVSDIELSCDEAK